MVDIDYEGAREVRQQRLADAFDRNIEMDGWLTTLRVIKLRMENIWAALDQPYSARFGDSA